MKTTREKCDGIDTCESNITVFVYQQACIEGKRSIYCPKAPHIWGWRRTPKEWKNRDSLPTTKEG